MIGGLSIVLMPIVGVAVFFLLLYRVEASNKFWIAASPGNFGDDANWSLSSGGPPNTTAPGVSDSAFFDGNGLGNCTIAANANVQGINVGSGYTGTIAVTSGITLTVGGAGFSQSAGTFNGGDSNIDVDGNFLLKGTGVFNSTTGTLFIGSGFDHNTSSNPGGTFNHNNGTVTFDGAFGGINSDLSGTIFNNVNFDHTDQRTINLRSGGGPTITVLGALALNDGKLFGSQIEVRGNLTISPSFDGAPSNHATLAISNGSVSRTITFAVGTNMLNVVLNDPNATIQASGSGTLNWRTLALQAGTINQGGVDFSFAPNGSGNYSQSGGTFNGSANSIAFQSQFNQSGGTFNGGSGDIDIDGNFLLQGTGVLNSTTGTLFLGGSFDHDTVSNPGGTFNHNNGTVVFDGNGSGALNLSVAGGTFNNLAFTLPDPGQRNLFGGPFIALGTLTLNNGTLFGGTLQPRGNVVIAGTFDGGSGTAVTFSGSNNQTFTNNGGANPTGTWTVNKTAGSVTLLSDLILGTGQSLNVTMGALDQGASFNLTAGGINVGASGTLRNLGTGDLTLGGDLANSGTLNFNGGTTACGEADSVLIRSSVSGAVRSWSGVGVFTVVDVDVQDHSANGVSGGINAFSSTDSGNNTNWHFVAGDCSLSITTHPMGQSVCPGGSVSFTVGASGTGLTYRWRKNGVNLVDGGNISGATTTMLTINPVGPADYASYDVVVTDSFGFTVVSAPAALTTVTGMVTNTLDSGVGSLRQAILDANGCPGLNNINFNIPGAGVQTITPLSALPIITDPVIIDGTTQPGFSGSPLIELNGASAGSSVDGLLITAGGSTVRGLVINGFGGDGIELQIGSGNTIQGCYIGTNASGSTPLPNAQNGIFINFGLSASHSNDIGGSNAAERNIISGNGQNGVFIGSDNNQLKGNFIGTDVTGTIEVSNGDNGVVIGSGNSNNNNLIGGATAGERNIISGNNDMGIDIAGGSSNNQVKGNFIGTDVTGTADLGNAGDGIFISRPDNLIGGAAAGEGNLISGNDRDGIRINLGATNNQVKGNFIGTDVTGTQDLGNSERGVLIASSAANNLIGGNNPGDRNVISGNNSDGISIQANTSNNQAKGNFIGTDVTGTLDLGNTSDGVEIRADNTSVVSNNIIGGTSAGEGNTIAFNARGVLVIQSTGTATGNAIRGNLIFSNDNLGIDLNPTGVTANDPGDADTGPNLLQNFPSILSANSDVTSTIIQVSLSSTPNTFFNLDFYSSPIADPSGFGEGKVFLGSRVAATQDTGDITFTATFNIAVTVGHFITTTATDLAGNTSEFSEARVVSEAGACATLELMPTSASFNDAGGGGLINVNKAAGCAWTTVSNASWITNVAPASGSGNGAVTYNVAANSSGCRSGTITIGGRTFTIYQSCPTAIELISFKAEAYEGGTFIEWRTGFEADNLGFNIYRDDGTTRTQVNSQLIAGSALSAGSTLLAGQSYGWWDVSMPEGASYWLEDIDLKGQSTLHGPFSPGRIGGKPPTRSRAALLSELGNKSVPDQSVTVEARAPLLQPSAAQIAQSGDLASRPAAKISVKNEGWYRVSQAELVAAGFDAAVDPRLLQLYVDGKQQPMIVSGEDDGRFGPGDAVEFYGTGLDSPFTDSRVFWLVVGDRPGLRVGLAKSEGPPSASQGFTATAERRDRSIYFAGLLNGEKENFFGSVIAAHTFDQTLRLSHLAEHAFGDGQLEVVLQGVTLSEHRVSVELNGAYVGQVSFSGQADGAAEFSVPQSMLNEGLNTVRLTALAGQSDVSLVNYIRISYQHLYRADDDALRLAATGRERIIIDGFSSKSIRVFDVTDASSPQELLGEINEQKTGYSVTFASPGEGQRALLVVAGQSRTAALTLNRPSTLRDTYADFLLITTRELASSLMPLAEVREKAGLSVAVIDVEDIYDEFSFGQKTPFAVRDFLAFASSTWKKKPQFVLFAGDSSYDPRNYLGFGYSDRIPTKLIDTDYIETSSDDWFSDFDGDGIADIATGRLPARTAEELSSMVAKIISYDQSGPSDEALLVSDANEGFDFEEASAELRSLIPGGLRITQVNRGRLDPEMARNSLIEAIYRKQFLVNYVGHGSVNQWRGSLLTNGEALELRNEHLPMFVMMTCLNGYFNDPASDSLGESLMKAEGGAVSAWASSGMTMPADQALLNRELYRLLFDRVSALTIGEAVIRAKATIGDRDIRRTWILLGDPAIKLK
jgi:hypothetical protein